MANAWVRGAPKRLPLIYYYISSRNASPKNKKEINVEASEVCQTSEVWDMPRVGIGPTSKP